MSNHDRATRSVRLTMGGALVVLFVAAALALNSRAGSTSSSFDSPDVATETADDSADGNDHRDMFCDSLRAQLGSLSAALEMATTGERRAAYEAEMKSTRTEREQRGCKSTPGPTTRVPGMASGQ